MCIFPRKLLWLFINQRCDDPHASREDCSINIVHVLVIGSHLYVMPMCPLLDMSRSLGDGVENVARSITRRLVLHW